MFANVGESGGCDDRHGRSIRWAYGCAKDLYVWMTGREIPHDLRDFTPVAVTAKSIGYSVADFDDAILVGTVVKICEADDGVRFAIDSESD